MENRRWLHGTRQTAQRVGYIAFGLMLESIIEVHRTEMWAALVAVCALIAIEWENAPEWLRGGRKPLVRWQVAWDGPRDRQWHRRRIRLGRAAHLPFEQLEGMGGQNVIEVPANCRVVFVDNPSAAIWHEQEDGTVRRYRSIVLGPGGDMRDVVVLVTRA